LAELLADFRKLRARKARLAAKVGTIVSLLCVLDPGALRGFCRFCLSLRCRRHEGD
jgi:hypothetical protein